MSSIPSSLRLFSPYLRRNPLLPATPIPKPTLLHARPLSSSTITFQRLPSSPLHRPVRSQLQQEAAATPPSPVEVTQLPPNLQEIISLFQSVQDPKAKYHQLLHYGSKLQPLDPRYKTEEHKVRGCVSQVWVRAFPDPIDPSAVQFEADSDSALTKGLAALLVKGLSGSPAPVIARVPPEFVQLLGLKQSLTPSRNNGFLNMLKLMQKKALQLCAEDGGSVPDGVSNGEGSDLVVGVDGFRGNLDTVVSGVNSSSVSSKTKRAISDAKESNLERNGNNTGDDFSISGVSEMVTDGYGSIDDASTSSHGGAVGRAERIREALQKGLSPIVLELEDISYQHAGHAGVRGSTGGETHFNLRVVSKEFEGKSMVKRQRLVYDLLQDELQGGLHALSIVAKTPSEVGSG